MKYIVKSNESIQEKLNNLNYGDTLFIENGIYNEKLFINNSNINIEGESQDGVIIRNHDFYHKIMSDNNECNTFRTYTVFIGGNNINVSNLTIENTSTPSSKYGQAVALHTDGNNLVFKNVTLKSAQDTLFTGPLPKNLLERYKDFLNTDLLKGSKSIQLYEKCKIIGDVDFIFGCATALFKNCIIHSLNSKQGYVCAPAHYYETKYGYLFLECNLTCEKNTKNVYLARPWRDYGACAFIDCKYGNHIRPEGFSNWENTNRDKTARFYEFTNDYDQSRRAFFTYKLSENEKDTYIKNYLKYMEDNK